MMMAGLLLDGLLILVVVLYVPIGAWRGGLREALLGGAILLGAMTAAAVAPGWGDGLADLAGTSTGGGRFLVAVALLLLVGLGVGFGAGVIAGPGLAGLESRLAGGLLGALNSLLFLSFGLVFLDRFLNDGLTNETVAAGLFAEALAEQQDWLFGLAALVAAGLVVAYRVMIQSDDQLPDPIRPSALEIAVPRRRLAVAPPADPEGGKVEPEPGSSGWEALNAEVRHRDLAVSTRPVVPTLTMTPERYESDRAATSGMTNGDGTPAPAASEPRAANGGRSVVDEWLRRAAQPGATSTSADDPHASDEWSTPTGPSVVFTDAAFRNLLDPPSSTPRSQLPKVDPLKELLPTVEPDPSSATTVNGDDHLSESGLDPVRRCPTCLTPAATGLITCPFCGSTL